MGSWNGVPRNGIGKYLSYKQQTTFWLNVHLEGDCLIWHGTSDPDGYGKFSLGWLFGAFRAHRLAYEMLIGEIPNEMVLDHLCRRPACVNPQHLEIVTLRENTLRGNGFAAINARKTHCKYGHLLEGENVYLAKRGRHCRVCSNRRTREWNLKRYGHKPRAVGEASHFAKLTADQVIHIRALRVAGNSFPELAKLFHVSLGSVHGICTGKTWKHLLNESANLPDHRAEHVPA